VAALPLCLVPACAGHADPIVPGDMTMVMEQTSDLIVVTQWPNTSGTSGGFASFNQEVSAVSSYRGVVPEFQPKGIDLDGFRLYPTMAANASYDDNVDRVHAGQKGDFLFTEAPGFQLLAGDELRVIDIFADAGFTQYAKLTSENTTDYNVGAVGYYSLSHATTLTAQVSYNGLHDPRSEADTNTSQAAPTKYNLFLADADATFKPNRLGIRFGGSVNRFSYMDAPLTGGGFIDNRDRDHSLYKGFAEVSYDFSPGYAAFVRATYDADDFALALDRSGIHRSSSGYQLDGGMDLLLSRLIQGEFYAGYLHQSYSLPLKSISDFDYGARLTWYPTEFLTVKLNASRQIDETTFDFTSGGDDRSLALSVDWGATYRLSLKANAAYDDTNYIGSLPARDDRTASAGLSAKYLISPYVTVQIGYQYSARASTIELASFDDNTVTVGANLQI